MSPDDVQFVFNSTVNSGTALTVEIVPETGDLLIRQTLAISLLCDIVSLADLLLVASSDGPGRLFSLPDLEAQVSLAATQ